MTKILSGPVGAILLLLMTAGTADSNGSGCFNIRTGIGYDFMSQEYFLDSLRYTDQDSSLKSALLKKDYLDDKKGFIFFSYDPRRHPDCNQTALFELGWEQTDDLYRAIGNGRLSLRTGRDRLEAEGGAEIKQRYNGDRRLGEELALISGQLRHLRQWNESLESKLKLYAEHLGFDSTGEYIYNYARFGGEVGLNLITPGFNSIFLTVGYERREVSDSGQLDYNLWRSTGAYFGFMGGTQISADLNLELKDYAGDSRDDYYLILLNTNFRIPVGPALYLKPSAELELFDFQADDYINSDYYLTRLGLQAEIERAGVSFILGPKFELLRIASPFEGDDDYLEYMAAAGIDYVGRTGLICLLENQLGRRTYNNDPEYTSDFTFDRLSLIGSGNLFGGLRLDLFLSVEWEWHRIDSDNTRLYLISNNLSYTF